MGGGTPTFSTGEGPVHSSQGRPTLLVLTMTRYTHCCIWVVAIKTLSYNHLFYWNTLIYNRTRQFQAIRDDTKVMAHIPACLRRHILIGIIIGLTHGQDVHRFTAELGYWLAEPFWGMGIATEAVKAISEYAFEQMDLYRIFAEPYATNPASARALEKAGSVLEGILRASAVNEGRVLDQLLYAKLSESI
jgi:RimJ/RimL family protein N-acetyltransferase